MNEVQGRFGMLSDRGDETPEVVGVGAEARFTSGPVCLLAPGGWRRGAGEVLSRPVDGGKTLGERRRKHEVEVNDEEVVEDGPQAPHE